MLSVKEDSRTLLERLRRAQLWDVADHYNIPYPPNASADVLRPILEAANVDVSKVVDLVAVDVPTEDGKSFRKEVYPMEKDHYTSNKEIDYDHYIMENYCRSFQNFV